MKCTWKECPLPAAVVQRDKNGKEWSNLCTAHDIELNEVMRGADAKKILASWVKASGGAEVLSKKMVK